MDEAAAERSRNLAAELSGIGAAIRQCLESIDWSGMSQGHVNAQTPAFEELLRNSNLSEEEIDLQLSMVNTIIAEVSAHYSHQMATAFSTLCRQLGAVIESCFARAIAAANAEPDEVGILICSKSVLLRLEYSLSVNPRGAITFRIA